MSDAPERIWLDVWAHTRYAERAGYSAFVKRAAGDVEYIRADIHEAEVQRLREERGLPEDLADEIRATIPLMRDRVNAVMHRVLAWHKAQQK
jgi:phosphoserine phosphatase